MKLLNEAQRVEVGALQLEPQANRLARESCEVGAGLPGNQSVDVVAAMWLAVGQRESTEGLAVGILKFDAETACSIA